MRDPAYHPHYPSKDGDYFERLMDHARIAANPFRLLFYTYTKAEEEALEALWQAKLTELKPRR